MSLKNMLGERNKIENEYIFLYTRIPHNDIYLNFWNMDQYINKREASIKGKKQISNRKQIRQGCGWGGKSDGMNQKRDQGNPPD